LLHHTDHRIYFSLTGHHFAMVSNPLFGYNLRPDQLCLTLPI